MNSVDLTKEFEKWFDHQVQDNGNAYSEKTREGYVYALSKACSEIENITIKETNLFYINSYDEFQRVSEIIRTNADFPRINKKFGNNQLSAAMNQYTKFLEEREHKGEVAWFVGSIINNQDQIQRFLDEGIWENGHDGKYTELVNSIKVGDRIAIKSSYTRKNNLPFDNQGNVVSVMGIKAIGVVTQNLQDGKKVSVRWEILDSVREWYFYTGRTAI